MQGVRIRRIAALPARRPRRRLGVCGVVWSLFGYPECGGWNVLGLCGACLSCPSRMWMRVIGVKRQARTLSTYALSLPIRSQLCVTFIGCHSDCMDGRACAHLHALCMPIHSRERVRVYTHTPRVTAGGSCSPTRKHTLTCTSTHALICGCGSWSHKRPRVTLDMTPGAVGGGLSASATPAESNLRVRPSILTPNPFIHAPVCVCVQQCMYV